MTCTLVSLLRSLRCGPPQPAGRRAMAGEGRPAVCSWPTLTWGRTGQSLHLTDHGSRALALLASAPAPHDREAEMHDSEKADDDAEPDF
jgi:hypothetical protein